MWHNGAMTDKNPLRWLVQGDAPKRAQRGDLGSAFSTKAEAESHAKNLREAGYTNVKILDLPLK
jgi:hypothetical protein